MKMKSSSQLPSTSHPPEKSSSSSLENGKCFRISWGNKFQSVTNSEGEDYDVEIDNNTGEIITKAHRKVLVESSAFFENLFGAADSEGKNNGSTTTTYYALTVNKSKTPLPEIIQLIYFGEVEVEGGDEGVEEFVDYAKFLEIKGFNEANVAVKSLQSSPEESNSSSSNGGDPFPYVPLLENEKMKFKFPSLPSLKKFLPPWFSKRKGKKPPPSSSSTIQDEIYFGSRATTGATSAAAATTAAVLPPSSGVSTGGGDPSSGGGGKGGRKEVKKNLRIEIQMQQPKPRQRIDRLYEDEETQI